jgi:hypothetical protein
VKHSGEWASTGDAVGGYENDAYDFGVMDEDCTLWGAQVRTTLRVDANGVKVK